MSMHIGNVQTVISGWWKHGRSDAVNRGNFLDNGQQSRLLVHRTTALSR